MPIPLGRPVRRSADTIGMTDTPDRPGSRKAATWRARRRFRHFLMPAGGLIEPVETISAAMRTRSTGVIPKACGAGADFSDSGRRAVRDLPVMCIAISPGDRPGRGFTAAKNGT